MNQSHPARSVVRGFTLLEALIALLVLSFGMLAIAGFHSTLSRNADLAKQRTEAMRLAQQKMESLRAFAQVESSTAVPHVVNYTDDVVGSIEPETFTTNAAYSRTWTVTANPAGTEKWVNVQVAWTDRAGQPQTVQLLSVIAKFDPQDIGVLATGTGPSNVRRPKNRNINIPYPAVTLWGGTQSAFIPPPGDIAYVFDNATGNIVRSCTGLSSTVPVPVAIQSLTRSGSEVTVNAAGHAFLVGHTVAITGTVEPGFVGQFTVASAEPGVRFTYTMSSPPAAAGTTSGTATRVAAQLLEGLDLANSGAACTAIDAYLLSGYIRFDTGNTPTGEEPGTLDETRHATKPLAASAPLSLDTSNVPSINLGGSPTMTCFAQRQKVVTTTNTAPVTITRISRSDEGNGSRVTVTAGNSFADGQTVVINGTGDRAYIGAFVISNRTASSFQYFLPPPRPAGSSDGGTAALVERLTIAEGANLVGYSDKSRFIAYACVVTPVNHDNLDSTAKRWWGKVTLNPNTDSSAGAVWGIGAGRPPRFNICRASADYNRNGAISNREHPQWYRGVTGPLASQNFLVIDRDEPCPVDKPANLLGNPPNHADDTTAEHQPNGVRSFQCGSGNRCNATTLEPESNSEDLKMD